jgi:hypothetical protein
MAGSGLVIASGQADSGAAPALSDIATEVERLAEGEPALAGRPKRPAILPKFVISE